MDGLIIELPFQGDWGLLPLTQRRCHWAEISQAFSLKDSMDEKNQAEISQAFSLKDICNVYAEGDLQEEVVCRKFRHTTPHLTYLVYLRAESPILVQPDGNASGYTTVTYQEHHR